MNSVARPQVARRVYVVASAVVFGASALDAHAEGVVEAVWKEQQVSFGSAVRALCIRAPDCALSSDRCSRSLGPIRR